jgi:uncharacterized phiE125 gp8 family phage protein
MALVTSDLSIDESDEPFDSEEALTHLREGDGQHAGEVMRLVAVAREYCERQTNRTLLVSRTRVLKLDGWPCDGFAFPWPPLKSITSITYYDEDGVSQTLSAGNYHVELSTDGKGKLYWDDDADLPSLDVRPDAVTITFVCGYEDKASIPRPAVHAIKTKLTELWADGTEGELKAAERCTDRLLNTVDITGYA